MPQGVLFDMDGLMFDTERLGHKGWHEAARQLGIHIPEDVIAAMRGTGVSRCREIFNQAVPGGVYDIAHEIRLAYAKDWIAEHGIPVKSGLRELLKFLEEEGIPAVLATSTQREQAEQYLDMAGIRRNFTATIYGPEVARPKPAPDIYLTAAAAIHADPRRCVVLEDSPNGLQAAKTAGCRTIVVPDLTPAPSPEKGMWDAKVENLNQVIPLLAQFDQI